MGKNGFRLEAFLEDLYFTAHLPPCGHIYLQQGNLFRENKSFPSEGLGRKRAVLEKVWARKTQCGTNGFSKAAARFPKELLLLQTRHSWVREGTTHSGFLSPS